MIKPKVLVMSGYGLNCEEETKHAFELVNTRAEIIHINDLISGTNKLAEYQVLAFPGGFSYGDDTGSGRAFANKIRNHLQEKIDGFTKKDTLVIGICNGFQILANLGLLKSDIALTHNKNARYTVRWVDLKVENQSPWLHGIQSLALPIAHGEGNIYADKGTMALLKKTKSIALRYIKGEICRHQELEANPNGSLEDIAGITDSSGRIIGLMPHPERAIYFTQLPHWTYLKEKNKRENKPVPKFGPGLQIFKNAAKYFS